MSIEVREQKQEAKRRIAKTSIDRIEDVFRHNGCSDPEASFEKGSETRSNRRKRKTIIFTKVGGMKKGG